MAEKVSRSDPSGTKTALDVASLDQVKAGKVVIELADGSDAVLGTVEQIISGLVKEEVANLLRQKTIDLEYQGNEAWVAATGNNNISSARGAFGADELNALSDWAVSYVIPSGVETTGEVVVRLQKGANPNDYRIVSSEAPVVVGDISPVGFVNSPTYDYYLITLTFVGGYAVGETIALEHHGEEGHSLYHGSVPELESAIQDLNSAFGSKADSADLQGLAEQLAGKEDARPFDASFGRNYYVKTNREAQTFYLQLHNIVPTLLPNVDTLFVQVKGQPVHTIAFNPATAADQVVPIELSAAEAANIVSNIRDDTTLRFDLHFRHGSTTVVHEIIQMPVLVAPPKRAKREILGFDLSRVNAVNATLPTDYSEWEMCKILVSEGSGTSRNTDLILIFTDDLARGNLTKYGRGKNQVDWNSTTRVLSPEGGASITSVDLI